MNAVGYMVYDPKRKCYISGTDYRYTPPRQIPCNEYRPPLLLPENEKTRQLEIEHRKINLKRYVLEKKIFSVNN